MTTLLTTATPNAFGQYFGCKTRALHSPSDLSSPISIESNNSQYCIPAQEHRRFSPTFARPGAPIAVDSNDENSSPVVRAQYAWLDTALKSTPNEKTSGQQQKPAPHIPRLHPATTPLLTKGSSPQDALSPQVITKHTLLHLAQSPKHHFHNDTPTRAKRKGCMNVSNTSQSDEYSQLPTSEQSSDSMEPFPILECKPKLTCDTELQTSHELTSGYALKPEPILGQSSRLNHIHHRQRSSNASSGFVHTIKTASMSNASFSIIPRSIRFGRSSDSNGHIRGYSRHSLDSDRPVADSLLDEATFRRGLRRKQIINELIMTEESYVADLKALVYLYSTLLASATAITSNMRTAIQRNVTELLQLHESLLAKFQQVTFKAAARKWADTAKPSRLELTHQIHWKNNGLNFRGGVQNKHTRVRSSIDSADVAKAHIVVGAAEPVDVLDIAEVLRSNITNLFAYEEYCANHEVIVHELQRHLPSLWSTYESGMESLGKSLLALNQRRHQNKKGLTVGDLLIKPVQRICKYPLLLEDLLRNTPFADSPSTHRALDGVLCQLRDIVRTVNRATDDHHTRLQIQRKWLLRDRLQLDEVAFSQAQFRSLGNVQLCGVLYLTYQDSKFDIQGNYAACVLFDNHFLMAIPTIKSAKLEPVAVVSLSDLQIESATAGKGLRSLSSLHTWKVLFTAENNLHEILLTACAKSENEQWMYGLQGNFRPKQYLQLSTMFDQSRVFKKMNTIGTAYRPFTILSQSLTLQQSTMLNEGANDCQVVLRNTYNPQDWQELRHISIDKTQNNSTKNKIVVLIPKRVERTRLENSLRDIYTKDRLPFPGMIGSTGSQIIRASAGSLVRKLSFASMQASFSRRSASLSSKKSYHTIHTVQRAPATFTVRKRSLDEQTPGRHNRPKELPELDTMDSVIGRMIGGGPVRKRLSFSSSDKLMRKNTKSSRSRKESCCDVVLEDPASVICKNENGTDLIEQAGTDYNAGKHGGATGAGNGNKRKRWSNSIAKLRSIRNDDTKNVLCSVK